MFDRNNLIKEGKVSKFDLIAMFIGSTGDYGPFK